MATITATSPRIRFQMSKPQVRSLAKGLLFISPALLGLALFAIVPMIQSLYYSFTDYNILQPPFWVGLENYQDLLKDRVFGISLVNTLIMVVIALPIHIVFDLAMAFLLNT